MRILIDCGASDGQSALFLEKEYGPFNKIYCFECNPLYRKAFNSFKKQVVYCERAVWIENKQLPFYLGGKKHNESSSLILEKKTGSLDKKNPLMVQAIDFPAWFLKEVNKEQYIVLKIDIEGAEYEVLEKMIETDGIDFVDILLVEFHRKKLKIPGIKQRHKKLYTNLLERVKRGTFMFKEWDLSP